MNDLKQNKMNTSIFSKITELFEAPLHTILIFLKYGVVWVALEIALILFPRQTGGEVLIL